MSTWPHDHVAGVGQPKDKETEHQQRNGINLIWYELKVL